MFGVLKVIDKDKYEIVEAKDFKFDSKYVLIKKGNLEDTVFNRHIPEIVYLIKPLMAKKEDNEIEILLDILNDKMWIKMSIFKIALFKEIEDEKKSKSENLGVVGRYRNRFPKGEEMKDFEVFTRTLINFLRENIKEEELRTPEDNTAIINQLSTLRNCKGKELTVARATDILALFHFNMKDFLKEAYKYVD